MSISISSPGGDRSKVRGAAMLVVLLAMLTLPAAAQTDGLQVRTDVGTRTVGAKALDTVRINRDGSDVEATQSRAITATVLGRKLLGAELSSELKSAGKAIASTLLLSVGGRILALPGNKTCAFPVASVTLPYQYGIVSCKLHANSAVSVGTRSRQTASTDSLVAYENGLKGEVGVTLAAEVGVPRASLKVTGAASPVVGDLALSTAFHLADGLVSRVAISSSATLLGTAAVDVCATLLGQSWTRRLAQWTFHERAVYDRTWTL